MTRQSKGSKKSFETDITGLLLSRSWRAWASLLVIHCHPLLTRQLTLDPYDSQTNSRDTESDRLAIVWPDGGGLGFGGHCIAL